jgi:hypothetical protein
MALQLYRQSKIGDCLAEALDDMVTQEKITGELATKVMAEVGSVKCVQYDC